MYERNAGHPALTQQQLDEIVHRLVTALSARRIYLFGSHVYGEPYQESDIDVMLVLPGSVPPVSVCYRQGCACLRGMSLPVQLHFASLRGFNRRRTLRGSLEHEIAERGILVYANES
jgi:hypothetical protein